MSRRPETVILVCPCCASPVDAEDSPYLQELQCNSCNQEWTMLVDAERCAEHSLT